MSFESLDDGCYLSVSTIKRYELGYAVSNETLKRIMKFFSVDSEGVILPQKDTKTIEVDLDRSVLEQNIIDENLYKTCQAVENVVLMLNKNSKRHEFKVIIHFLKKSK